MTDELISYIIRIPGLIYEKQKPTSIKKYKALVDSGARMNIINPILVPHNCIEPSTLAAISTATDRVDTPWQCTMKLYLSKDKWIIITAVLFKIDHGMILGSPFLARLWPNGLTRQKGKFGHHFTIQDESIFFPFIMKNEPSVLHIIEAIQEHLGEIQKEKEKIKTELQLSDPKYITALNKVRHSLLKSCSLNPTEFWHIFKHEVNLQYVPYVPYSYEVNLDILKINFMFEYMPKLCWI